jgi:hypothetical protein
MKATSFGSAKSRTTKFTPNSSRSVRSWVEATPTVGTPAATEEPIPEGGVLKCYGLASNEA